MGGPIGGNSFDKLSDARADIDRLQDHDDVTAQVLVDTEKLVVQVFKGTVEPFRKGLNVRNPGWQIGEVVE